MIPSKATRDEWRKLAEATQFVSAVGEYTPAEFVVLLNAVDALVTSCGVTMDKSEQQKLMDSLTPEQRKGVAEIIRSADIEGDYHWNGEDSVWCESVSETLSCLAAYFDSYDPKSALD